ncbi:MAG: RcpC/CpaB family pilus assembly protein [Candidatus Nanopelagicales bacterium]|nr:RcpC/CpaB family pilus assembly protein [Candidatus Nanopelagicales bacterium]MDZ4249595.1 RcpC/CpaB family pilus assembly protein [Candidatus Nanopelagicales bacterium]
MTSTRLRALIWRHGRLIRVCLAVLLAAAAVTSWLSEETAAATHPVTVASRDLPSGATISEGDLTTAYDTLGLTTTPIPEAVGRTLRGPMSVGEPITDTRLVPSGDVRAVPGKLVFPLKISDERVAALLHSGDRVDVLSSPGLSEQGRTVTLAGNVEVLAVPARDDSGPLSGSNMAESGAIVLLSVDPPTADALAAARPTDHVAVAIR